MGTSPFTNARVRMQRLSDAKLFNGWVLVFDDMHLVTKLRDPLPLSAQDMFLVEIHGMERNAQFKGILAELNDSVVTIAIPEPIRYHAARENGRFFVDELKGTVQMGTVKAPITVEDLSRGGVGARTSLQLPRGEIQKFSIESLDGDIQFEAEVRYCKPVPGAEGQFRVGLAIRSMDRLATARYMKYFQNAA